MSDAEVVNTYRLVDDLRKALVDVYATIDSMDKMPPTLEPRLIEMDIAIEKAYAYLAPHNPKG